MILLVQARSDSASSASGGGIAPCCGLSFASPLRFWQATGN